MPNHHMLNYKPGVTLDAPITVEMAAADWIALMTFFSGDVNTDGIHHLIFGLISPQLIDKLYTKESTKAAEANMHARMEAANPLNFIQSLSGIVTDPANFNWQQGEIGEDNDENEEK